LELSGGQLTGVLDVNLHLKKKARIPTYSREMIAASESAVTFRASQRDGGGGKSGIEGGGRTHYGGRTNDKEGGFA